MMILDLNMPVMDGWSFLAERDREPALSEIPVIIVPGNEGADADRRREREVSAEAPHP